MGLHHNPRIVTDGLVFAYDVANGKSYKGAPTTNVVSNPTGTTGAGTPGSYTPGWDTILHPTAFTVTSWGGGYNGGVPSPTIGYHGQWVNEGVDGGPCIKHIDLNDLYALGHRWLGISKSLGTPSSLGWIVGDEITVSWLQKSDISGKGANVGLYHMRVTEGTRNFEINIAYVKNIGPYDEWERVSFTSTITSNWNLTSGVDLFCYGHSGNYGTLWCDDFQVEKTSVVTPFVDGTRSPTESIYDLTGNNAITATSITPTADNTFRIATLGEYISLPNSLGYTTSVSIFSWFRSLGIPAGGYHIICGGQHLELSVPTDGTLRSGVFTTARHVSNHGSGLMDGKWHYIGFTFAGTTKTSYIDGADVGNLTTSGALVSSFADRTIGKFGSNANYGSPTDIYMYRVYDRALSAAEVKQNFEAIRSRFGI